MDSSKSDVATSSVADYLEKEKLCQEICRTITESVESTNNVPITSLNIQPSALLPELNSDQEIEAILQQISDYLGTQFGENSQCSDDGVSEGLSVEEILKEAENLVRASTPYFERKHSTQINSSDPLPLVKNIKHLNSVKKFIQKNYFSKSNVQSREHNINSDENDINKPLQENNDDIVNSNSNNFNCNNNNNNATSSSNIEENYVNDNLEVNQNELVPSIGAEEKRLDIVQNELTLMDLQSVPPGSTYTIVKEDKKLCRSMSDINNHLLDENKNKIAELNQQIAILTAKVADYEKLEANLRRSENLAAVERQRVKLLQDEIKSQEDLIDSYQNENQRLSNDIISAKVGFLNF
ncbi:hypothetical protein O3M35_008608 [Rhynocoris fuscipes]|uniref:Uncharacterized protein n=1 Tax=Rhynocoris fuscipes TaxID=488301 RepID=A0AAW1D9L4_9HEMI